MTKRSKFLILVLILALTLSTLAGCSELGDVNDIISNIKDTVEGVLNPGLPACEHEGGAANCTEPAACEKCGEAYGEALGHDIVSDAAVAADCENSGLTAGEHCTRCDYKVAQEVVAALGHDMAEATCTNPAYCKREGCAYTDGTPKDHSYDEGVVTTAPGCEAKGVKTYTCTVDGCGHSYEEEVAEAGHSYSDTAVVPSTCISQGYTEHTCANCGDTYRDNEQPLAAHTYVGVETIAPACESAGLMTYTCFVAGCGDSYTEEISATGHAEVEHEGKAAACTENGWNAYVTCENCDYTTYEEIEAVGHSGGKATCIAPAVCDNCGKSYGMPDKANGHNYGEADCDSPATCAICNETSGSAIGHIDENKDHKCDRCDTEQGVHEDKNSDHACDYGCSEFMGVCEDNDLDHDCDYGCDKVFGECVDADRDHDCDYGCPVVFGEHADGDDNDHNCDYCDKFVDGEECVDENKNHKCDECYAQMGEHADGDDSDHLCDYCNGAVEGEECHGGTASCTQKAVCEECGAEYGELEAHVFDKKIVSDDSLKTEATCLVPGIFYYSCSNCRKVDDSEGAKTFESGEALGHKDANRDHLCDNGCEIPQGEHADSMFDDNHLCDYGCGKDASEHEYSAEVKAPTCTDGGYTTYTCNCGHSYVGDEVEKLGHSYKSVVTAPTCENGGYTTYTCSVCGDTYKDNAVDALGHKYEAVVTAPTCFAAGYTTHTCPGCGDSYKDSETAQLTHIDADEDELCDNGCGTEMPKPRYTVTLNYGSHTKTLEVKEGSKLTAADLALDSKYPFAVVEWQKDGVAYDLDSAVMGEITLTAVLESYKIFESPEDWKNSGSTTNTEIADENDPEDTILQFTTVGNYSGIYSQNLHLHEDFTDVRYIYLVVRVSVDTKINLRFFKENNAFATTYMQAGENVAADGKWHIVCVDLDSLTTFSKEEIKLMLVMSTVAATVDVDEIYFAREEIEIELPKEEAPAGVIYTYDFDSKDGLYFSGGATSMSIATDEFGNSTISGTIASYGAVYTKNVNTTADLSELKYVYVKVKTSTALQLRVIAGDNLSNSSRRSFASASSVKTSDGYTVLKFDLTNWGSATGADFGITDIQMLALVRNASNSATYDIDQIILASEELTFN